MAKKITDPNYEKLFGELPKKRAFPWMLISAVSLLLAVSIMLGVFLNRSLGIVHLVSSDSGSSYTDTKAKVTYLLAPMCYEPIDYYGDAYAKCGDLEFHKIDKADPHEYICTADSGIYDIYYADTLTLPSFEQFGSNRIRICQIGTVAIQTGTVKEKETVSDIANYYINAESVEKPSSSSIDSVLYLKFMSDDYPFMYFILTFYTAKDGSRYIYDRTTGKCVDLGDNFADVLYKSQESK